MRTQHAETVYRDVQSIVPGLPTSDGAGVRLTRMIGSPMLDMLDPFLLLDVIESDDAADYIAGFPPHPHRGFETFTWLLDGRMRHKDSFGNEGVIESGGAQWMSAGRGIIHSEMPEQEEGKLKGIQLWINLPARLKMSEPDYADLSFAGLPVDEREDGAVVRVLAGRTSRGAVGLESGRPTELQLFDVSLQTAQQLDEPVPAHHNAFVWVAEGRARIGNVELPAGNMATLMNGERVSIEGLADGTRLLLASAAPLNEPVARGGPFVMNTQAEILQAFADYQSGRLAAQD